MSAIKIDKKISKYRVQKAEDKAARSCRRGSVAPRSPRPSPSSSPRSR